MDNTHTPTHTKRMIEKNQATHRKPVVVTILVAAATTKGPHTTEAEVLLDELSVELPFFLAALVLDHHVSLLLGDLRKETFQKIRQSTQEI